MILIFDDTFEERINDYPVNFLSQEKYIEIIKIIPIVLGSQINNYEALIKEASCVACHRTMKFYGNSGRVLSNEKNIDFFSRLESFINKYNSPYISFSGSNTTTRQISPNKIILNKREFYFNLQSFADNLIEKRTIEFKVLSYGKNWIGYELAVIQNNIFLILDKYSSVTLLQDVENMDVSLFNELRRFNEISNLFSNFETWIDYLNRHFKEVGLARPFLSKIVKSYIKYGKYIYNL